MNAVIVTYKGYLADLKAALPGFALYEMRREPTAVYLVVTKKER